jgi:hypothetical protein
MTCGCSIHMNINGDRSNLKTQRRDPRELFYSYRILTERFTVVCRPRSGFSFLSTPDGVLLHGKSIGHQALSYHLTDVHRNQAATAKNTSRGNVRWASCSTTPGSFGMQWIRLSKT